MNVAVIVPVLDEAAGIAAALARLQPLRSDNAVIVVADGGSMDDTAALAAPLADRVVVAPRGRGSQMNAGAAAAPDADAYLFLHADTVLPDGALAAARAALRGTSWGRFDVVIDGHHPLLPVVAWFMNRRSRLTGIATGDQAMFMTRAAFAQAGGFPDIALMEDIAMSSLLRKMSAPACLALTVKTSGRRWERRGVVRTILTMWTLRLRFFLGAEPDDLARAYGYRPRGRA
jgi:rSAM/selenodomain-associated transferase 2